MDRKTVTLKRFPPKINGAFPMRKFVNLWWNRAPHDISPTSLFQTNGVVELLCLGRFVWEDCDAMFEQLPCSRGGRRDLQQIVSASQLDGEGAHCSGHCPAICIECRHKMQYACAFSKEYAWTFFKSICAWCWQAGRSQMGRSYELYGGSKEETANRDSRDGH